MQSRFTEVEPPQTNQVLSSGKRTNFLERKKLCQISFILDFRKVIPHGKLLPKAGEDRD